MNDPSAANGFTTGLKTYAGKPKVTLAAYRMPLYLPVSSTAKGHPLVVWGEVRPAPDAAAQTHRLKSCRSSSAPARAAPSRPSSVSS